MQTAGMLDIYLKLGWRLVPISQDKHAGSILGRSWQNKTSSKKSKIEEWLKLDPWGWALHLGPHSGVIDIESDSPEGNEITKNLFAKINTPIFVSGRSTHYLFKWDKRLDELNLIKYDVNQIEYRVGGKTPTGRPKGCISMVPPTPDREWVMSPEDTALAVIPDKVIETLYNIKKNEVVVPAPSPPTSCTDGDVSDARIISYLESTPGAISGQRGHDHTFRVCAKLVRDWDLPISRARPHILVWNQKCEPPWTEKELFRKLEEAKDKGRKEAGNDVNPHSNIDISAIISPKQAKTPQPKATFPKNCEQIPGLIGEIVSFNCETARYPQPELALAGALSLMSVITGRKIESNDRCRTNLYILGLAHSSVGKDYAQAVNSRIMESVGESAQIYMGPNQINSASGIVSCLVRHPALLFQVDEMGRFLRSASNPKTPSYLSNTISLFLNLFTVSDRDWMSGALADTRKIKTIVQPHCCFYGTSTPQVFWDALTYESVTEGFLGRLILFHGFSEKLKSIKGVRPSRRVPESITKQVKWWVEGELCRLRQDKPNPIFLKPDDDAQERYDDYVEHVEDRCHGDGRASDALWRRSTHKTLKLAMLFAASKRSYDLEMVIELEDMNRAIALSNYTTRTMVSGVKENVYETEYEKKFKSIMKYIQNAIEKDRDITVSDVGRAFRHYKKKEREEVLDDMESQGIIYRETIHTGKGRPPVRIQWIYG